jgi:hypothetical protein
MKFQLPSILLCSTLLMSCGSGSDDDSANGDDESNASNLPDLVNASHMVDVDKDGDLDLVLGAQGDTRGYDILLLNDGMGNFTERDNSFPMHHLGTRGATINITSADFNNDGNPDIIASTSDAGEGTFDDTIQIQLYLGDGTGNFSDATANITDGLLTEYVEWIRVADFDNDGNTDFLITSNGGPDVSNVGHGGRIYLNDGAANFTIATIVSTDAERSYTDTRLVWENDGNVYPTQKGSDRFALDVFVDDLNGDNMPDLIANNSFTGAGPVVVSFLNTSTAGNLSFDIVYNLSDPIDPFTGTVFKNGAMLDIDGDGFKDIVGSNSISGTPDVTVPLVAFLNQGNGVFTEDNTLFVVSQPGVQHARQWLVEDFDQDGNDDLIVADHGYDLLPAPGAANLLLINNGSGQLADVSASNLSTLTGFTHGVSAGDINGDGFPDLFLNNAVIMEGNTFFLAENEPRLWINDGDGSFTAAEL